MSISSPSPTSDRPSSPPDATPHEPPVAVRRSFQLWVAALIVGVLGGLVSLLVAVLFRPVLVDRAVATGVDPQIAGTVVVVAAVVVGLLEIAVAALGYFFAVKMRAGRNWARIVLALLAVIGIGDLVVAATTHNHPVMTVTGALHVLLMFAAVLFAFQPAASDWFRRRGDA